MRVVCIKWNFFPAFWLTETFRKEKINVSKAYPKMVPPIK